MILAKYDASQESKFATSIVGFIEYDRALKSRAIAIEEEETEEGSESTVSEEVVVVVPTPPSHSTPIKCEGTLSSNQPIMIQESVHMPTWSTTIRKEPPQEALKRKETPHPHCPYSYLEEGSCGGRGSVWAHSKPVARGRTRSHRQKKGRKGRSPPPPFVRAEEIA